MYRSCLVFALATIAACPVKSPDDSGDTNETPPSDTQETGDADTTETDTGDSSETEEPGCEFTVDVATAGYVLADELGGDWSDKDVAEVDAIGDITGDGADDLAVGVMPWDPGDHDSVLLIDAGADPRSIHAVVAFRLKLAVDGDLNGDGVADALYSDDSGFSVFHGPLRTEDSTLVFDEALSAAEYACSDVPNAQFIRDQDGDGTDEILFEDHTDSDGGGDPCTGDEAPDSAGAAFILRGPTWDGQEVQADYDVKLVQDPDVHGMYILYMGRSDLDGDGLGDLVVAEGSRILTVLGEVDGYQILDDVASASWEMEDDFYFWNRAFPSTLDDWDGDGLADIVLPMAWDEILVLPGDASGGDLDGAASTHIRTPGGGGDTARAVTEQADDVDGDGRAELLVGLTDRCDEGRAYLVPYPGEGSHEVEDVSTAVYGVGGDDGRPGLGASMEGEVDFDLDGKTDVILVQQYANTGFILSGGGL